MKKALVPRVVTLISFVFLAAHAKRAEAAESQCGTEPYHACAASMTCNESEGWIVTAAEPAGTPCSTTYNGPITGTCAVSGSGRFVTATCEPRSPPSTFTVSVNVLGLRAGTTLMFSDNASSATSTLTVSSNGLHAFAKALPNVSHYAVKITSPPLLDLICSMGSGSAGVVNNAGVIVQVRCQVPSTPANSVDVLTQHNNNARQGAQLAETVLTPASIKPIGVLGHSVAQFGQLFERHVVGTLLAQPLYVHGVLIKGRRLNVIYVATSEDVVYAFDADDHSAETTTSSQETNEMGQPTPVEESTKWLWKVSLGHGQVGHICGETDPPIVGISSTPVIDLSTSTMYVVARDQGDATPPDTNSAQNSGLDYLHALDITTGLDLLPKQAIGAGNSISASMPGASGNTVSAYFQPDCQRQRPGLLLQKGTVYLGYGTYQCDAGCLDGEPYRG